MTHRTTLTVLALAAGLVLTAATARAAEYRFAYSVSYIDYRSSYGELFGVYEDDPGQDALEGLGLDDLDPGFLAGGAFLFSADGRLFATVGIDLGKMEFASVDASMTFLDYSGSFRYYLLRHARGVYAGGTLGYTRMATRAPGTKISAGALLLGPTLGVTVPMVGVGLDLGATLAFQSTSHFGGATFSNEDSSVLGARLILRLGLQIPVGQ